MKRRGLILGAAVAVAAPRMALAASAPVVGVTLPLTGVQAEVATEMEAGYRLAFAEVGGVTLRVLDDQSRTENAAKNVRELAADPSVVAVSGIVGTPHAQAALPFATEAGLPVVGIRSGAQSLRDGAPNVFHLRSSFDDELGRMVRFCQSAGFKRMAVLYSEDSFGTASRDHLERLLAASGIELVSSVGVERNGGNVEAAAQKTADAALSRGATATAIALLLIVKPMVAMARQLRQTHRLMGPMFSMSFTITRTVATARDVNLAGLGIVSAFPLPRSSTNELSRQYRAAVKRFLPDSPGMVESVTGFEAYFYGSVLARAIGAGGTTRDALLKKLRAGLPLGGDVRIAFDQKQVGYRHLEFLLKSSDGLLRA